MTKKGKPFRSPTTTPMLPPELWNHIFQFFNPDDLYSVTKTCPEWNKLLDDTKNTFLLPLVLPSVMKYVDLHNTLKFRRITKWTKYAVEKTLQSFSNSDDEEAFDRPKSHYDESSSKRYLRNVAGRISSSYTFTLSDFAMLLDHVFPDLSVISSDVNPFLVRYVSYISDEDRNVDNPRHVLSILPKFGHHLSSLRCIICGDVSNQPFQDIISQLRLVPNIKRLWIRPVLPGNSMDIDLTQASTTLYDFPALPKLVILSFKLIVPNLLERTFALAMVRHSSQQLICFTCDAALFALQDLSVDVLNTMFSNVKKFHLLGKESDFATGVWKLSKVSWSLERLHLEVYNKGFINAQTLMSTISNFHRSLKHLKVDCVIQSKQLEVDKSKECEGGKGNQANVQTQNPHSELIQYGLKFILPISTRSVSATGTASY